MGWFYYIWDAAFSFTAAIPSGNKVGATNFTGLSGYICYKPNKHFPSSFLVLSCGAWFVDRLLYAHGLDGIIEDAPRVG